MYKKLFPGALRKGACAITLATAALVGLTANANAYDLTISTSASQDITSTSSASLTTFTANGSAANLNVTDLQNAIALTSVKVKTGSSGSQPGNITVATPVSWSSHTLTLDAYLSIYVNSQLSASSTAALTLKTDDGGSGGNLWFTSRATFTSTSEALTINGTGYTLVPDIATLASDVASNSSGNYALANNYNASGDGTYSSAPISTTFNGTFNGLGNTISNLTVDTTGSAGLFAETGSSATIASVNLASANITGSASGSTYIGTLIALNEGTLFSDFIDSVSQVAAAFSGPYDIGGLAGANSGSIGFSQSAATVFGGATTSGNGSIGGLVGYNGSGGISNSFSTGSVLDNNANQSATNRTYIGGLVGYSDTDTIISYSYSTSEVTDTTPSPAILWMGGLTGFQNDSLLEYSFFSGSVSGSTYDGGITIGGLVGGSFGSDTENCYSTGDVSNTGITSQIVGGAIGRDGTSSTFSYSYASGLISYYTGQPWVGGVFGYDNAESNVDGYWDTTSTGITNSSQGTGSPTNDPGLTGLTNTQLKASLPSGFSSTIWTQSADINGGLPYLINNPPQEMYRAVGHKGRLIRPH